MKKPEDLAKEAEKVNFKEFLELIDECNQILIEETSGSSDLNVTGLLVKLPPIGEAIVVGDIHGDINSLIHILKESRFMEKAFNDELVYMIFLGDYGDRGFYSPEVYYVVMTLKKMFPNKVILMRGNHEGPDDLLAYPHDLPQHLERKFRGKGELAYSRLKKIFDYLHTAVLIEGRYVMLHGGVPSEAVSIDDVAYAHEKHPAESHLEEILWSDPREGMLGTYFSPRGAGRLFGKDVTQRFLRMVNANIIVRGHEPCDDGYRINHNGRVLTLFSRKGAPYYNRKGAYLYLNLSEPIKKASQLALDLYRF